MNNNRVIVYCTPDYMINTKDFYKYIKIGIKTKGYNMIESDNLLVCIGFVGKLSNSSKTKYKLDFTRTLEMLGSKGIQCIKARDFSPEINAGLEWKIGNFLEKSTLIPKDNVMYTNSAKRTSLRFGDYRRQAIRQVDDNSEIDTEEVVSVRMMVEIESFTRKDCRELLDKEYERLGENEEAKKQLGSLYRIKVLDDIIIGKLDPREIFLFKDPRSPYFKIESVKMNQQDQFSSSSNPQLGINNNTQEIPSNRNDGNVPYLPGNISLGRPSNYVEDNRQYKNFGKRQPVDAHLNFLPPAPTSGTILNIAAWDSQNWIQVRDQWEINAVRAQKQLSYEQTSEEMWSYMELLLGDTIRYTYEAFKRDRSEFLKTQIDLGVNLYNFTTLIRQLILGNDPHRNNTYYQTEVLKLLDQLSIHKWKYIAQYCQDFFSLAARLGKALDPEIGEKNFRKLPGQLGVEIKEKWEKRDDINKTLGIGARIKHTYEILREKCTQIQIQKQLKKHSFSFCKDVIYTPQNYGLGDIKKKKKFKKYRQYNDKSDRKPKHKYFRSRNKRYFIKKSKNFRKNTKPQQNHLKKSKIHSKCKCFICGEESHLTNKCPKKKQNIERVQIIEDIGDDFLEIESQISDNDSIYSLIEQNLKIEELSKKEYSSSASSEDELSI